MAEAVVLGYSRSESVISGSERASFFALPLPVAALGTSQRSAPTVIAQVIPGPEWGGSSCSRPSIFLLDFGAAPDMATARGAKSVLLRLLQTALSEEGKGAVERERRIPAQMRDWARAAIASGTLTVPTRRKPS